MKQLPRACCITLLALAAAGCNAVSDLDAGLRRLDLGSDTYISRAGDTLETVAYRYRLSATELAALNPGLKGRLRVGTALSIKVRSRVPAVIAANETQPKARTTEILAAAREADVVITQPVYKPIAVPNRETRVADPIVYTPAVSAVVSDIALSSPAQVQVPAVPQQQVMRKGVMEPITFARQEIVEEEYIHGESPVNSPSRDDELQSYAGGWAWPTQGQVARGFAPNTEGRHGVDIAGLPGQQVVAVMDGTVAYSGKDPSGAGNLIIVRHDDDLLTAYSHTKDLFVAEQDTVRAGDPIATLGANSRQESVLRFEVRQNGNPLNPMDFLTDR